MKKLLIYILVCCQICCSRRSTIKTGLEGKLMPKFNILLIDSSTNFSSANIPTGKSNTLLYFSPHCPYCQAEVKTIIEDINRLKEIHFYMITNSPFSELKKFNNKYKLNNYSNITIGTDPFFFFAKYFKAPGVPYLAIYGKDKKLNGVFIGLVKSKDIEAVANE
jgi:thiol-disulfide isomerase/thioredoxin